MPLQEYLKPNRALLGLRDIRVALPAGVTPSQVDDLKVELESAPQLYYCGVQIPLDGVSQFVLDASGFLPRLTLSFRDQTNLVSDAALPGDDSLITLRVPARSQLLAYLHLDFKILRMSYTEDTVRTFDIEGVCSVNHMLVRKFRSWPNATSWEVLKAVAAECGLGFRSNVSSTADRMTWVCPGATYAEFATDWLLPHAWAGESSYMWAFVDPFYNLTYVDVERALAEDGLSQVAVLSNPAIQAALSDRDVVDKLVLTNDPAGKNTNSMFSRARVTNVSTDTSLRNGYVRDAYFYDVAGNWDKKAGAFLQFSVDSITSPGAEKKSLILKGAPGDAAFVQANRGRSYAGRIDTDNVYPDYAYATVQNAQNLGDLQKVSVSLTLPQPNMNLYRFQKVPLVFSNMYKPGVDSADVNLKYAYDNSNKLVQHVQGVKRELNVKDLTM
jgi:hypothetical protein